MSLGLFLACGTSSPPSGETDTPGTSGGYTRRAVVRGGVGSGDPQRVRWANTPIGVPTETDGGDGRPSCSAKYRV